MPNNALFMEITPYWPWAFIKNTIRYRNIVAAMGCVFYKVPGHPFVICDYGNGSGSYFFMVITKSNRIVINNIMYSLSIAITPLCRDDGITALFSLFRTYLPSYYTPKYYKFQYFFEKQMAAV